MGIDAEFSTGICSSDYLIQLNRQCGLDSIDPYFATGNAHGTAAGRLSYFLNWQGASLAIDTACSSSLVAVHFAMQSIRNMECDVAMVLGVNLILAAKSQHRTFASPACCRRVVASERFRKARWIRSR